MITFAELRSAAYCPRQCYYDRTSGDREPPTGIERVRELAFRYEASLAADHLTLAEAPIEVDPAVYQARLARVRRTVSRWNELCEPDGRDVLATGRECRGVIHKVLADPPAPSIVSTGRPPERGVWEPQSIHAVAAAKALARERATSVDHAYVEYPAHGVVRRVELTTRRKARYRRTLRTVREIDGPPPRTSDRSKCDACEYAPKCGVRTRTLRSLLGRG
ncbi:Dna2/Cas4 domain-containing protein [Halovivax sp.]|uniref:CRISPR-associated protein Cas4 n=1 Tax=Halovivax sp. TaxID=1935978 RepID=UPI003743B44A